MTDSTLPKPTAGSTQLSPAKPVAKLEPTDQKQLPKAASTVQPISSSSDVGVSQQKLSAPTSATGSGQTLSTNQENMKNFAGVSTLPVNPAAPPQPVTPPGQKSLDTHLEKNVGGPADQSTVAKKNENVPIVKPVVTAAKPSPTPSNSPVISSAGDKPSIPVGQPPGQPKVTPVKPVQNPMSVSAPQQKPISGQIPSVLPPAQPTPRPATPVATPTVALRPAQIGNVPLSAPPKAASTPVPTPGRPPVPAASPAAPMTPRPGAGPVSAPTAIPPVPAKVVPPSSTTSAAQAAGSPPQPPKPEAKVKSSILRFLPFVVLGTLLFAAIGFGIYWLFGRSNQPSTPVGEENPPAVQQKVITYWGLWEPSAVMDTVIRDYEAQNPGIKIEYKQESHREYRERLQTKIAEGQGPDIFRYHASWVPMMQNELSPLPEKIMSRSEFSQTFYPSAEQLLTVNNSILGIPLMYEGLGLYYNTQIFSVANKTPPTNWEDMKTVAQELTIKSGSTITRSGLSMGTTNNVEHFADILALLMMQNKVDLRNPTSQEAIDAMDFYTSFSKSLGVWDSTLPSSTLAFSRGDVAMMIAPSWRVHEIKAKNPNLEFAVAPVPQVPGADKVTLTSFWAEGVSAQSKNKEEAWDFLKYLSSAEVQKKFFSAAREVRAFGEIYSRRDLASELASDKYVGAYLQDALQSKGWYMNAYTHDAGINDRIIKYYEDAVNSVYAGQQTAKVLETVKQGIDQVIGQYQTQ